MKIDQIFKYIGLVSLIITGLMMVGGVIGFFAGEFLNVVRYSNFFWFANSFALFGIFNMVAFMAIRKEA